MIDFTRKQKENLKWFEDNLNHLLKNPNYKNKYLVIHDKKVLNAFDHSSQALNFVLKTFNNSFDECIIQEAVDSKEVMNFVNVRLKKII